MPPSPGRRPAAGLRSWKLSWLQRIKEGVCSGLTVAVLWQVNAEATLSTTSCHLPAKLPSRLVVPGLALVVAACKRLSLHDCTNCACVAGRRPTKLPISSRSC